MSTIALFLLALVVSAIATFTDIKERKIPNNLIYAGIAAAIVLRIIYPPLHWGIYFVGFLPAVAMYLVTLFKGHFGMGDIKLALFLGIIFGGGAPFALVAITFVLMIFWKLIQMFVPVGRESVPMAPFFFLSTMILMFINGSMRLVM